MKVTWQPDNKFFLQPEGKNSSEESRFLTALRDLALYPEASIRVLGSEDLTFASPGLPERAVVGMTLQVVNARQLPKV